MLEAYREHVEARAALGIVPKPLGAGQTAELVELLKFPPQGEEEGYYNILGTAGARTEMPGCSLCMGNQARVEPGSTVLSTSTRNFPNRLGDGVNVYLVSAELAAIGGILGRLPTVGEYMEYATRIDSMSDEIFRYMNFDQLSDYAEAAERGREMAIEQLGDAA